MDLFRRVCPVSDYAGFIGGAYEMPSRYQDGQLSINLYRVVDEVKPQGARGVIALYPTPGLVTRVQLANQMAVRQMYPLAGGNVLLAVAGNGLYSINLAYAVTSVGTLLTGSGPVSITDNGTSAYLCDGSNRYSYDIASQTLATLSDGAFNGANTVDIIDNFIIYNNPESNQWGSTSAGSVVSPALSEGAFLSASGNVIGLIADHRQVYLLGEKCSEVWTDQGLFPFPFAVVPGSTMQHGCAGRGSIARLGESFAFLAQDTRGKATVVQMDGYSAKRISTYPIEKAMQDYDVVSDAIAYTYNQSGHEFYMLTFPDADVTWCYDISSGLWHQRAWRDSRNVLHRHRSNCAAVFGGENLVGDFENGKIYAFSESVYTDDGDAIACVRRCPHITEDLNWQRYHTLQIQFQPGVGLEAGQGENPQAMLRWSNDGGSTFGNEHWTSIGRIGKYKNRARWRRMGQARDRVFEVTTTDPVYRTIISADLVVSPGSN